LFILLLPFSFSSQALSATTSGMIHGSAPYLTFDGRRMTDTSGFLWITISDAAGNKQTFTPTTNPSSESNPIELLNPNDKFTNVEMLVATDSSSIPLNSVVNSFPNYWGDDDGDGQGSGGITATGNLNLTIKDKYNKTVARNESLDICKAPYKVTLSATDGELKTEYGIPQNSNFSASSVDYYINPKLPPKVCFVRPNLTYSVGSYDGPISIWNPDKGFIPQSIVPSSYNLNFPTTGANNLYFDLEVGGSVGHLSWMIVPSRVGSIEISVRPADYAAKNVRVILSGPYIPESRMNSSTPGPAAQPSLPARFELVGTDIDNKGIKVKYGFELKQWFVHRGTVADNYSNSLSWCSHIGYRLPKVRDLTNAVCAGLGSGSWCQGAVGATPSSPVNHYQRRIGAGFFTEWGNMNDYTHANFLYDHYWTTDTTGITQFLVASATGYVRDRSLDSMAYSVFTTP
jgi:hypothetical protein